MYERPDSVRVEPGSRAAGLCGASRPGHFAGVLTVVAKLLNLLRPDIAIFGRKDAQQCLVIAEMVSALDFRVRLIDHATVREPDGLALSSRNRYLDAHQRQRALALWRSLLAARTLLEAGQRDLEALRSTMRRELQTTDQLDYAEVLTVPELTVPERAAGRLLIAVAAHVGRTRLIDNLVLEVDENGVTDASLLDAEANL
jgi:pantoate--beta-alanine ligase